PHPSLLPPFSIHFIAAPLNLPSFPTRRSSDLEQRRSGELLLQVRARPLARARRRDLHAQERARLDAEVPAQEPRLLPCAAAQGRDRKSTRLNSSHVSISYAVFCLKKKNTKSLA